MPAADPHPLGLWYRDCRFLSGHELCLNGVPAELLQASDALGTRALHEMTNSELPLADARVHGDLEVVLEIAGDRRTLIDV